MFLLMGFGEGDQDIGLHQKMICPICGRRAHLEAYFHYRSFNIFFAPFYKWDKEYYLRTSCCGVIAPLSAQKGEKIYWGQIERLPLEKIDFGMDTGLKVCKHCGFETMEQFQYCPHCGKRLQGGQKCLK